MITNETSLSNSKLHFTCCNLATKSSDPKDIFSLKLAQKHSYPLKLYF